MSKVYLDAKELHGLITAATERHGAAVFDLYPGAVAAWARASKRGAFSAVMMDFGHSKIAVIKVWRAHTGMGLKESKDAVESAPISLPSVPLMSDFIRDLRAVGASVRAEL